MVLTITVSWVRLMLFSWGKKSHARYNVEQNTCHDNFGYQYSKWITLNVIIAGALQPRRDQSESVGENSWWWGRPGRQGRRENWKWNLNFFWSAVWMWSKQIKKICFSCWSVAVSCIQEKDKQHGEWQFTLVFSLYISAQFIRDLMEEIFFPFPFPQNFHVTAAIALQRKLISYVAYRDAQCLGRKNNFKPFFFFKWSNFWDWPWIVLRTVLLYWSIWDRIPVACAGENSMSPWEDRSLD